MDNKKITEICQTMVAIKQVFGKRFYKIEVDIIIRVIAYGIPLAIIYNLVK